MPLTHQTLQVGDRMKNEFFLDDLWKIIHGEPLKYGQISGWLMRYENDITDALEDQKKYRGILESVDGFLIAEASKMVDGFTDTVLKELKKRIRVETIEIQLEVGPKAG